MYILEMLAFLKVFYSVRVVQVRTFSVSEDGLLGLCQAENSFLLPVQEEQLADRSLFGRRGSYGQQSQRLEVTLPLSRDRHYNPCSWNRSSHETDRPNLGNHR